MSCHHKPKFKFSQLFARRPLYVCSKCGQTIELAARFRNIVRVINTLFIMIVLFRAFSRDSAASDMKTFWMNMLILLAAVVVYMAAIIAIFIFGSYEEYYEEIEESSSSATDSSDDGSEGSEQEIGQGSLAADAKEDLPKRDKDGEYTSEQLELMAMYAAYEEKAIENGEIEPPQEDQADASEDSTIADNCEHVPTASWKNYVPSKMDFICAKCGEAVTFSPQRKKTMNMIYLAVMVLILMPNFMNENINFWQYSLLTLGALVIATFLQIFFVKKWPLELKK